MAEILWTDAKPDPKRAALNIRTTTSVKDQLAKVAEANGRTLSQEADFRLSMSLARDQDVSSREAAMFGELVRILTTRIEAQSGESWTDDYDTFVAVQSGVLALMEVNGPPEARSAREAIETADEARGRLGAESTRERAALLEAADQEEAIRRKNRIDDLSAQSLELNKARATAIIDKSEREQRMRPYVTASLDSLSQIFRIKPDARRG